jgi:N6-adenosine-specific RNA methylase IME4
VRLIESGPFSGQASHQARLIAADPPWKFETFVADEPGDRAPEYPTMTTEQIMALPVNELAWRDCWLLLWTSGPHLESARQVMKAWGFRYSTIAFTWAKLRKNYTDSILDNPWHRGLGKTTRKNTELVLLGRLGAPRVMGRPDELIVSAVREHSRKPDEFYQRAVTFAGDVPRIELFARQSRPGWATWGNEATKFDHQAVEAPTPRRRKM